MAHRNCLVINENVRQRIARYPGANPKCTALFWNKIETQLLVAKFAKNTLPRKHLITPFRLLSDSYSQSAADKII